MEKSLAQVPQSTGLSQDPSPPNNKIGTGGTTPAIQFSQEEQIYHKHLTLGIEEKLHKNRMIKDITRTVRQPTEKPTISGWERKYGVILPTDLKQFYFSTNGFKLTWSLEHAGDNLKIGEMNINQISQLLPLEFIDPPGHGGSSSGETGNGRGGGLSSTKLFDVKKASLGKLKLSGNLSRRKLSQLSTVASDEVAVTESSNFSAYFSELRQTMEANGQAKSKEAVGLFLGPNDKAFIFDYGKYGWVCLIYPETKNKSIVHPPPKPPQASEPSVEIWFLDISLKWHYLAPSFSHYYRMLLFHLGLPQWQYRFTPYGLSSWAEQMFWLVAPHLLTSPNITKVNTSSDLWSTDVPPEASAPNSTPNVLSSLMFKRKRKDKVEDGGGM